MARSQKTVEQIDATEVSSQFIDGMRNRMRLSFYKYGPVADAYPEKVDSIGSLMQRLRLYAKGDEAKGIAAGNTEYLMDAANFAMIEFMHPRHPQAYFKGTDDDGSPGRIAADTGRADKRDNAEIGSNPDSITAAFR